MPAYIRPSDGFRIEVEAGSEMEARIIAWHFVPEGAAPPNPAPEPPSDAAPRPKSRRRRRRTTQENSE